MKKVLVAYYSRTGMTEKMAENIAEGIRFSGNDVVIKKISDLKSEKDFAMSIFEGVASLFSAAIPCLTLFTG